MSVRPTCSIAHLRNDCHWKYIRGDYAMGAQRTESVRDLTSRVVARLKDTMASLDCPVTLNFDIASKRCRKGSFVIFDGETTTLIPFKLANNFIVIRSKTLYLACAEGVMLLVGGLIDEIETVMYTPDRKIVARQTT